MATPVHFSFAVATLADVLRTASSLWGSTAHQGCSIYYICYVYAYTGSWEDLEKCP